MPIRKRWIPLTGDLVLRRLDEQSGLTFRDLQDSLGLDIGPGPMALIFTLIDLADAGLVTIDGSTSQETYSAARADCYSYMFGAPYVWRTTVQWMKTTNALSHVRMGTRRDNDGRPLLCYPVYGSPGDHLEQCDLFVIMPFAEVLKPVYEDHLRKVAEDLNLSIRRADDFYTNKAMMADIWSAICASSLVIADCTGRNPNVFYELGIAHTVGVPVMMIARSSDDIPSDLKHLRYYVYDYTPRGMIDLEDAVRRVVDSTLVDRA